MLLISLLCICLPACLPACLSVCLSVCVCTHVCVCVCVLVDVYVDCRPFCKGYEAHKCNCVLPSDPGEPACGDACLNRSAFTTLSLTHLAAELKLQLSVSCCHRPIVTDARLSLSHCKACLCVEFADENFAGIAKRNRSQFVKKKFSFIR